MKRAPSMTDTEHARAKDVLYRITDALGTVERRIREGADIDDPHWSGTYRDLLEKVSDGIAEVLAMGRDRDGDEGGEL